MLWCDIRTGRIERAPDRPAEEEPEETLTYTDTVEPTEDAEAYGLRAGAVGTIVDVHDEPPMFEVEFIDQRTETTALMPLPPELLRAAEPG